MVEDAAHIFGGEVRLQRPGRVGVAEGRGEVGDVGEHHPLVAQGRAGIDRLAVNDETEFHGLLLRRTHASRHMRIAESR